MPKKKNETAYAMRLKQLAEKNYQEKLQDSNETRWDSFRLNVLLDEVETDNGKSRKVFVHYDAFIFTSTSKDNEEKRTLITPAGAGSNGSMLYAMYNLTTIQIAGIKTGRWVCNEAGLACYTRPGVLYLAKEATDIGRCPEFAVDIPSADEAEFIRKGFFSTWSNFDSISVERVIQEKELSEAIRRGTSVYIPIDEIC